jgi:galactose oxidase-like protein
MRPPIRSAVAALLVSLAAGPLAAAPAGPRPAIPASVAAARGGPAGQATAVADTALPPWIERTVIGTTADAPPARIAAGEASLATGPSGRFLHSAILDAPRNRMIVFGGRLSRDLIYTAEVLSLPLLGPPGWQLMTPTGQLPSARASHSAIYDPVRQRMIVFGGHDGARLNDVYALSMTGTPVWTRMTVTGTPPSPRNLHSAIYDPVRDRMIVFGGYENSSFLNDVWAMNLSGTPTWTRISVAGPVPVPRREHTAIYDPVRDRMIIFGGLTGSDFRSDVWALSLGATPAWTQITAPGASARFGHTAIYDGARDRMVVFGGENGDYLADTWELTLSGTPAWNRIAPTGTAPAGREYPSMIAQDSQRAVIFGGLGYPLYDDTWALGLPPTQTWSEIPTTGPTPYVPVLPTFSSPIAPSASSIVLGQSFSVTVSARNNGAEAADGQISISFPKFTDPTDGQWVTDPPASGDNPGYVEHPAGSTLTASSCQPITASYLEVDQSDDSWSAASAETNDLHVTVQPQKTGVFTFDIRCTMRVSGSPDCVYVNGVPAEGSSGYVDQQGWGVRRFSVAVYDKPVPVFTAAAGLSLPSIIVGESFTVTASAVNLGAPSDDGRISISFPGLTDPLDVQRVSSSSTGDTPGYQARAAGSTLSSATCQPVTASYLVAEYADQDWQGFGAETNAFTVAVQPPRVGTFYVYVRSTMRAIDANPCILINGVPEGGESGFIDQQGFSVTRYSVRVDPIPPPAPAFHPAPTFSRTSIIVGESFTVTARVWSDGGPSDDGRISISFPGLTDPLDVQRVSSTSAGDTPGYQAWGAGSTLSNAACQPVTASYLDAEYGDQDWKGLRSETNVFVVTVVPPTVGDFSVYVRSTMRDPAAGPCVLINGAPSGGQSGFIDQQGFPVTRYSVRVDSLPPPATPVFTSFVISPTSTTPGLMTLGQSIAISCTVRNDGGHSDDGRVVFSFPVACGVIPAPHPAGSTLFDANCQPIVTTYPVTEFQDTDWAGPGTETNTFQVSIIPTAVGTFYFDVRATMHAQGINCQYANALPASGIGGVVDEQGWPVKRFYFTVRPNTPAPVIPSPITGIPATVPYGQPFTFTVTARNDGTYASDGRIVVGFPDLTDPVDADQVSNGTSGDSPGYREVRAGETVDGANCQPVTVPYLIAEYADNFWGGFDQGSPELTETNSISLTVLPRRVGDLTIDVRSTMRQGTACNWQNGLPPNGDGGYTDALGWAVKRYHVQVTPPALTVPDPIFTAPVTLSATNITLGEWFTVTASVRNDGDDSDEGTIAFSFPTLTGADEIEPTSSGSIGDNPGYVEWGPGSPIVASSCQSLTASYPTAGYVDDSWYGLLYGQERNTLSVRVRPRAAGIVYIDVRTTMRRAGSACSYVNAVPTFGESGHTDQFGWTVKRYAVTVDPPPAGTTGPLPLFTVSPTGFPTSITLGESFTFNASVRNDGLASDDGRIVISFPYLTRPEDGQWVTCASSGDAPGYREYPAGTALIRKDCQLTPASYLVAEYADDDWTGGGTETNPISVTVRPQEVGVFAFEVRSTMHIGSGGPCDAVSSVPAGGYAGYVDQQGWDVHRFEVVVNPPSVPPRPPTVNWSPITPAGTGPAARSGSTVVYDVGRDALVVYGGSAGHYFDDIWSLPLAAGSAWSTIVPGGPVPLRRTMHSMIYNPIEDHLVIFGGLYDTYMNDLWLIARNPVAWWFPIAVPGVQPSGRLGHAAIYDPVRARMLVIGGFDGLLKNDVWEYSPMVNGRWRQLQPLGAPFPARANHSAVYDPVRDRVLVFGGDGGLFLNDVWELRLNGALTWNLLTPSGPPPSRRREHTAIYHAQWDQMIVFGGYDGTRRNDIWALSLAGTPSWERLYSSTTSPAGRSLHSAVYDPVRKRMVVFGGQTGTNAYSKDLWSLTVDAPTPTALSLSRVEAEPDRVRITWSGTGAAALAATVQRSTDASEWTILGVPEVLGPDQLVWEDRAVSPGARYAYRLVVQEDGAAVETEPVWVTVPGRAELTLAGASPNPVSNILSVTFTLPGDGAASLALFDLRGRLVARQDVGGLGAGEHHVVLADGRRLAAGVYLVRLTRGSQKLTAKACVMR